MQVGTPLPSLKPDAARGALALEAVPPPGGNAALSLSPPTSSSLSLDTTSRSPDLAQDGVTTPLRLKKKTHHSSRT